MVPVKRETQQVVSSTMTGLVRGWWIFFPQSEFMWHSQLWGRGWRVWFWIECETGREVGAPEGAIESRYVAASLKRWPDGRLRADDRWERPNIGREVSGAERTSGAKAPAAFCAVTARLKSCPSRSRNIKAFSVRLIRAIAGPGWGIGGREGGWTGESPVPTRVVAAGLRLRGLAVFCGGPRRRACAERIAGS